MFYLKVPLRALAEYVSSVFLKPMCISPFYLDFKFFSWFLLQPSYISFYLHGKHNVVSKNHNICGFISSKINLQAWKERSIYSTCHCFFYLKKNVVMSHIVLNKNKWTRLTFILFFPLLSFSYRRNRNSLKGSDWWKNNCETYNIR